MAVVIGMFLLGFLIAFGTWAISWSDHVKKELVVKVFFNAGVNRSEVDQVSARLDANPLVKSVTLVTAKEGLERVKKRNPELFKGAQLPYNPLGPALTVQPVRGEDTERIADTLRPFPAGVHNVNYGKKTAHRILRVAHVIEAFFLIAVAVLLAAATLLIANTIRLSIFARRREIEVMKLVGATNWFVRGPFMLEGLLCGLAGSVAAVVLLVLGKELALPGILGHINAGSDVHALPFTLNALCLLGAGLLLGAAGSGLTIRRFLRI
jgi:cell division transport system permease protein